MLPASERPYPLVVPWLPLLLVLLGGLTGCNPAGTGGAEATGLPLVYFDLKGFLDEQRRQLDAAAPTVTRTVQTDATAPEIQRLTHVAWERELTFFYEADLNRPALRGAYATATTPLPDGGQRLVYTHKPGEAGAISRLVVEKTAAGGVRLIQAVQGEENALFTSARRLELRCAPDLSSNRLLAYEVVGSQKLVFFAPTTYTVRAEID